MPGPDTCCRTYAFALVFPVPTRTQVQSWLPELRGSPPRLLHVHYFSMATNTGFTFRLLSARWLPSFLPQAPEVSRCPLKAQPDENKDNASVAYTAAVGESREQGASGAWAEGRGRLAVWCPASPSARR